MANAQGKGRGGKNNFPSKIPEPVTLEEKNALAKALDEVMDAYKQKPVKSDDELMERLSEYFEKCNARNSIPTVEEMCMYTGYSIWYIHDIECGRRKGFGPESAQLIKKAKDYMKTLDGKLAIQGDINFLAYCFRAKNYYGMVDKVEHVVTPTIENALPDTTSIKERYQIETSDIIDQKKD